MEAARDMHLTQKEQSEGKIELDHDGSAVILASFFFAATAWQKERVVAAPHFTSAMYAARH